METDNRIIPKMSLVERLRSDSFSLPSDGDYKIRNGDMLPSNSLTQAADKIEELQSAYNELIFSVSIKFPDETRHGTALRYIKQAESHENNTCNNA